MTSGLARFWILPAFSYGMCRNRAHRCSQCYARGAGLSRSPRASDRAVSARRYHGCSGPQLVAARGACSVVTIRSGADVSALPLQAWFPIRVLLHDRRAPACRCRAGTHSEDHAKNDDDAL